MKAVFYKPILELRIDGPDRNELFNLFVILENHSGVPGDEIHLLELDRQSLVHLRRFLEPFKTKEIA